MKRKQIELIIAPGTKASYQVIVDDKVVLSESVSYPRIMQSGNLDIRERCYA